MENKCDICELDLMEDEYTICEFCEENLNDSSFCELITEYN